MGLQMGGTPSADLHPPGPPLPSLPEPSPQELLQQANMMQPTDIMEKLSQGFLYREDMENLIKWLKMCLDNGILSNDQINEVSMIMGGHPPDQLLHRPPVPPPPPKERPVPNNLLHLGICYFIWKNEKHEEDPTLFANLYREKIRKVDSSAARGRVAITAIRKLGSLTAL